MEDDTKNKLIVTVNEKILLLLKDYTSLREEKDVPKVITQRGIANAIGILPSHVPRALKKLINEQLIVERDGYVEGGMRKSRVYFLTENGILVTRKLAEKVGSIVIQIKKDGKLSSVPLSEVNMHLRTKLTLLQLYNHSHMYSCFDLNRLDSGHKIVEFTSQAPKVSVFIDREKDFENLKKLTNERKVIVIFGVSGIGKTAIAGKYIEGLRGKQCIFWYQLDLSDTIQDIFESLSEFLELMGTKALKEQMKSPKINVADCIGTALDSISETDTLLVFDGYHEPSEDIVEFFYMLVNMIQETKGVKVLITAREDIPFYNWFYSRKEIDHGIVGEIRLKGLDRDSSKKILAVKNIEDDAYKQIYQLTKGIPQLLAYVRDNNTDALKLTGLFTAQEIRLMLGLKNVLKK